MKQLLKDFIYNLLIQFPSDIIFKKLFPFWQSLGFYLTRNHYYEPIPDTRTLSSTLWTQSLNLKSIFFDIKSQLKLLNTLASKYKKEYSKFPLNPTDSPYPHYYTWNHSFGGLDGTILYCMIRYFKASRIIEIGSGFSTLIAALAIQRNVTEGKYSKLTIIDPYPSKLIKGTLPNNSELIAKKLQETPISKFLELGEGDILFIDSSHMLKIGSDCYHLFLKVLPSLEKGVIIHFHDIFLPSEYPKDNVLKRYYFYNEQYFLYTFLSFNNSFKVLWASNYLNSNYPEKLKVHFPTFTGKNLNPSSFWIQKIR